MARRRRYRWKKKALTAEAKVIWKAAFPGVPWPKGWRVEWVGFMRGAVGLTIYSEKRILLSWGDRHRWNWLHTLCHEFIHVRWRKLRHGRDFDRLTEGAYRKVWEA